MTTRQLPLLVAFLAVVLLAAAPAEGERPEDLIRQANTAFAAEDWDAATQLYEAAEERTQDPGLVAFNRAAVLFQQARYAEAEMLYARVLSDAACSPERFARASYNRGTCLLRVGGSSSVYGEAIGFLEQCLESRGADAPLKADARINLEIAKKLWRQAIEAEGKKQTPNDIPPPETLPNEPPEPRTVDTEPEQQPSDPQGGTGNAGPQRPDQQQKAGNTDPKDQQTNKGNNPSHGGSTAPIIEPRDNLAIPHTPEQTRDFLRAIAERLRQDRRDALREAYPTPLPGDRDW